MGLVSFIKTYCEETTLHGFRYLAEGSSLVERVLWVLFISTAFTCAGIMVGTNLRDGQKNPITVSIETIPVQDLPFPAVTINAAKLEHPFRLVEAVYNDVKIDCRFFQPEYDESCQSCFDKTKNFRTEHQTAIKEMLEFQYSNYEHACFKELTDTDNEEKSLERLSNFLKSSCLNFHSEPAVNVVHACMSNLTDDFSDFIYAITTLTDMMEKTFRVSDCEAGEMFDDFLALCNDRFNITNYGTCTDQINDLAETETFCNAFGILNTVIPQVKDMKFVAGIVSKANRRKAKHYSGPDPMYQSSLNLLNALNEKEDIGMDFLFNCSYSDIIVGSLKDCNRMIQDEFWLSNMDLVYKLKKQTIAPASKFVNEKMEMSDIENIKQVLQDEHSFKLNKYSILNDYATILACKYGNIDLAEECNMFSNTFVSTGIGYTFNGQPFWTTYKNSSSTYAFYKELYGKEETFEDELPRKIINAGQVFSFEFYVRHNPYGYQHKKEDSGHRLGDQYSGEDKEYRPEVFIGLHDPSHLPNLKSEGLLIEPGMSYKIMIQPTITETDKSALDLDNKTRNCLAKMENDGLKLFNYYSQSACIFECKLKQAVAMCNCSSWDYPRIDASAPICVEDNYSEIQGYSDDIDPDRTCFHDAMQNETLEANCDCANDCDQIVYDTDVQVSTLQSKGQGNNNIARFWAQRYDFLKYLDGYRGSYYKQDLEDPWLKELSMVQITVQRRLATKITRSARHSFSSQLASLGGIIGLFTGMSILSLAESVYWIMKYFKHMLFSKHSRI